jgi:hypothetical protein
VKIENEAEHEAVQARITELLECEADTDEEADAQLDELAALKTATILYETERESDEHDDHFNGTMASRCRPMGIFAYRSASAFEGIGEVADVLIHFSPSRSDSCANGSCRYRDPRVTSHLRWCPINCLLLRPR